MKKLLAIVLAAVLVLSAFAGCGKQTDTTAPNAENKEQTGTQSTTSDGGSLVIWVEKSFSEDVDKLFDERIQAFGQEKGVKGQGRVHQRYRLYDEAECCCRSGQRSGSYPGEPL